MKCRSSERGGCAREGGYGTFGAFCADHAAELASLRARWFTASGSVRKLPADETEPSAVEDDARAVAIEVLRAGRVTRIAASEAVGIRAGPAERAITYAERAGWIETTRQGLTPGEAIPGKLPREVRAAMLARFVREEERTVPAAEAAAAIGLERVGSFARVVAFAREQGWITSSRGSGGGIAAAA